MLLMQRTEVIMANKGEIAENYFRNGLNCAQAVLAAFEEETGLSHETALAVSSSFGGGMGRLREVCGAVSGMFMVAGLLYGNKLSKMEHYALIQELAAEFKEENGSIVCRELLGVGGAQVPIPEKRTEEYYKKRPCAELVHIAADIMDRKIAEMNKNV